MFKGGGSRYPNSNEMYFEGDGSKLKIAFDTIGPSFIHKFLDKNNYTPKDINHVFTHQVSVPYYDAFKKSCGFIDSQVEETVSWCGNVAAASIPLAWSLRDNRKEMHSGDIVLLVGLAGGISVGVSLVCI